MNKGKKYICLRLFQVGVFLLLAVFLSVSRCFVAKAEGNANDKVEKVKDSIVRIRTTFWDGDVFEGGALGSGFAVGDGTSVEYMVTNHHVILPAEIVEKMNNEGKQFSRKIELILGRDDYVEVESDAVLDMSVTDIAVLKLKKPLNIPPVTFMTSESVKLTQEVFALGFPGAADVTNIIPTGSTEDLTITNGTIGKIGPIHWLNGVKCYQTNAAINSGNSGGALVDSSGNVIGIVVAKPTEVSEGIGYAIQVDELLPQLEKRGIKFKKAAAQSTEQSQTTPQLAPSEEPAKSAVSEVKDTKPTLAPVAEVSKKGTQSNNWLIFIVIGAVVVVLLVIVIMLLLVKQKKKVPAAVPSNPYPSAGPAVPSFEPHTPAPSLPIVRTGKIYGITGPFAGSDIVLGVEPITIGRDPRICQLVFPDNHTDVGRKHCIIRYNEGAKTFLLEDCFSTNGTFMSTGERLQPGISRTLRSGERFYLSGPENMFEVRLE